MSFGYRGHAELRAKLTAVKAEVRFNREFMSDKNDYSDKERLFGKNRIDREGNYPDFLAASQRSLQEI